MSPEIALRQTALFSGLSGEQLKAVASCAVQKFVSKGETIFMDGDPATGFYVIGTGTVKIYKLSSDGKEHILHVLSPGDSFGEAAMFSGKNFPAYAEAVTKAELFFIPVSDMLSLVKKHPEFSFAMLASMSRWLRQFVTTIEELSLMEVPARLAKYLLESAARGGVGAQEGGEVMLNITKKELAAKLGTVSETLSRTFQKLKKQRLIRVSGNRITILNKEKLQKLCAGG